MRSLHVMSIAGAFAVAMPILAQAQRPTTSIPGRTSTTQTCSPVQVIKRECVPANTRTQTGRYPTGTVYPQRRPSPTTQYPAYPQQYPNYPNYPRYPSYPTYPSYPQSSTREVILPDGQRCMEHVDGTGRAHYNCPQGHGKSHGKGHGKWNKGDRNDDRHDRRADDARDSRDSHGRDRSGGYRPY